MYTRLTLTFVATLLHVGCELPGVTTPRVEVHLTDTEFNEYWRQLERRWPVWYESRCAPSWEPLAGKELVREKLRFFEVPTAFLSTCTYGARKANIGDDKWDSGCVPHEIGHAVCDIVFDRATWCTDFEHPTYRHRCGG